MSAESVRRSIAAMIMNPRDLEIFQTSPCNLKSNADLARHTELVEEFTCRNISETGGRSWQYLRLVRECHRKYKRSSSRIRCTTCGRIIRGGRLFGVLVASECEPCWDAGVFKRSIIDLRSTVHYNPDDPRPWPNKKGRY